MAPHATRGPRTDRLTFLIAALVIALGVALPRPASSQSNPPGAAVAKELARLAASEDVRGFHVGVEVVEIDTGRVMAAAGEHQPLNPASNEKLVTTVAVLSKLRPEYRFETGIYGPSTKGSVLSG